MKTLIAAALEDIARALGHGVSAGEGEEEPTITIGEMERVLRRYANYQPLEVQLQLKKLKERLQISLRVAEQRLKRISKVTDVVEVDALLDEYDDAEQHIAAPLLLAQKHRQNLQGSLFFQIRNALKLDLSQQGVYVLDRLLEKADGFGDDLLAETQALHRTRDEAIERATERMVLLSHKQVDDQDGDLEIDTGEHFVEVDAAVAQYEKFCDDEKHQAALEALRAHRDALVENARVTLRDAVSLDEPAQIAALITRHEAYADIVAVEKEAARGRWLELVEEGRDELHDALHNKSSTIETMGAVLEKYKAYPRLEKERTLLQVRLDSVLRLARETLEAAAASGDISTVEGAIAELDVAPGEGEAHAEVAALVLRVKTQQEALVAAMHAKLKLAAQSDDPEHIESVLEESLRFDSTMLDTERKRVEMRLAHTIESICADLCELASSEDFLVVAEAIDTFSEFEEKTKRHWAMPLLALEQHRDDLVDSARARLRALKAGDDIEAIGRALQSVIDWSCESVS